MENKLKISILNLDNLLCKPFFKICISLSVLSFYKNLDEEEKNFVCVKNINIKMLINVV